MHRNVYICMFVRGIGPSIAAVNKHGVAHHNAVAYPHGPLELVR